MKKKNFNKALAFTLAEVLITLSILGVVAAITVPSLVKRNEEKSTVAKVLKMYSTLEDATALVMSEYETMPKFMQSGDWAENFSKYLNITKFCPGANQGKCFADIPFKTESGYDDYWGPKGFPSASLKDGMSVSYWGINGSCAGTMDGVSNVCFGLFFDVDGPNKGKHIWGSDIFTFFITKNGVMPGPYTKTNCQVDLKKPRGGKYISGCTDYVVKNKNMNYLHQK